MGKYNRYTQQRAQACWERTRTSMAYEFYSSSMVQEVTEKGEICKMVQANC